MRLPWILAAALLASGCGLHTVDGEVFRDMTVDKKLRLFEAENDVSIAEDERDQMRDRAREIKQDIHTAAQEQRAAEKSDDDEKGKLLGLAARMWEQRGVYLRESLDYLRSRMDAQDAVIDLARAKFELAKALLIKKNKLQGADGIDIKDFERQVSTYSERMRVAMAGLDRVKAKVEKSRAEWLKLRDDLSASSLEGSATPGADEIPVWESW
ncbi:MAG TPA: hypothetical protein VFH51_09420 [Myxococcota bacterium]|nr:hypothetical protein [Myxococcota bacterium]